MAGVVSLTGLSGKMYQFTVYGVNVTWNPVPGLYAFVDSSGNPKYIGQTDDFSSRRPGPSHEKWPLAQRYGAIYVAALTTYGGGDDRIESEADLIRAYNPPCNIQQRSGLLSQALLGS